FTLQVTPWFAEPFTEAANCWLVFVRTLALAGETVTETPLPDWRAWPELDDTISPETSTTSKSDPFTFPNTWRSLLSQRESGAPEMYQADPLSAIIMPYFLSARRIT